MKLCRFRSCAADQCGRRKLFRGGIAAVLISFPSFGQVAVTSSGSFSGGGISTSGSYSVTASLGCIGGSSAGGTVFNSGGGPTAQPGTAKALRLTVPASVNESATGQLSGTATMNDDTATPLAGSDINWSSPAWPILSITTSGVVSAAVVYTDTVATVSGQYLGNNDSAELLVRDSQPDNYGSYAGDGLPDWWQIQHFGMDNPNAGPNTVCSNRNNTVLQAYIAGLNPTNSIARFGINQRTKNVMEWNAVSGRVYNVYWTTNLMNGFQPLETNIPWTRGSFTNSTVAPRGFYKIDVRLEN